MRRTTNKQDIPDNWKSLSPQQQFERWNTDFDLQPDILSRKALRLAAEIMARKGILNPKYDSGIHAELRHRHIDPDVIMVALKLQGLI